MGADVLAKEDRGAGLFEDAGDLGPEPALVFGAKPLAGVALSLARVARSDDIHDAAPRSAVEGGNVVPDRSRRQGRLFHPGHEAGRGVGFPLDVTHSAISGLGDRDAEVETTASGK